MKRSQYVVSSPPLPFFLIQFLTDDNGEGLKKEFNSTHEIKTNRSLQSSCSVAAKVNALQRRLIALFFYYWVFVLPSFAFILLPLLCSIPSFLLSYQSKAAKWRQENGKSEKKERGNRVGVISFIEAAAAAAVRCSPKQTVQQQ